MKLIFVTNGSLDHNFRNFNYYQRIYHFAYWTEETVFVNHDALISNEIQNICKIIKSNLKGKTGLFFYLLIKFKKFRNCDLIITEPSSFCLFGVISKVFFKKKWVIDIWDIPFRDLKLSFFSKLKRKLQVLFFRPIFRKADLFIVSILPDFQLKEFKLPEQKMRCFTNSIFLDEHESLPSLDSFEKFTILIQRSQFYKGFGLDLMLNAFYLILKKIDAQLLIVGKLMPDAKVLIDQFPFNEKIIETGFVEHDEFKRLALKSHICVIPYPKTVDLEQIYPIKAIEFMALGKAIVYTKIEGLYRLIGEAGMMVNEISAQNLADKICYLYEHPEERLELERRAKEKSKLFDAKIKNELIFQYLKELVKKSK